MLVTGKPSWIDQGVVRAMFSILFGLLLWTSVLIADLRDPFDGLHVVTS